MAWLLLFIMRDTSVSVVFSWVMTFVMSYGSIITGLSVSEQTAMDFAVSVLVSSKLFNWIFVIATQTALVLEHPVVCSLPPTRSLTALRCGVGITWKTAPSFIASSIGLLVLGVAIYHVSPKVQRTKIHIYVDLFLMYVDIIAASVGHTRP
ncbi:uncharacterized protein IUM83_18086 [Phytophthora cinnamomi]|uniref:uncharacterized protein n=1 Tax=Phytophthora cinnamomi TaxID=4785 RepID=UPI00355A3189|nr:hypothetical protein IUM83_18086 [Phytophthora cinnamomi]